MKLVVAVVQDQDTDRLLREAVDAGLRATRLASTGGYLRSGNTTVLLGVPDRLLGRCLSIVRACCRTRVEPLAAAIGQDAFGLDASGVAEASFGGGVVFVVPVRRFERVA